MTRILMVLSAADKWTRSDGSIYESGVWAEEFVVVDETLIQTGLQVDIATPGGVAPTIDARSAARLEQPQVLAEIDEDTYGAVVIPGGHGPVEDL